jgi:hypothetical protein
MVDITACSKCNTLSGEFMEDILTYVTRGNCLRHFLLPPSFVELGGGRNIMSDATFLAHPSPS